jgi:cytochrome P450
MSAVLAPATDEGLNAPLDAAFVQNPYPRYRAWREAGRLHWRPAFFGGAWVLSHHADVEAALRDPRLSAQRTGGWVMQDDTARQELKGFQELFARAMLFVDAPEHPRLRRVMNAGFRADTIQALAPQIEAMVTRRLDAITSPEQGFDAMAALARPLPAEVIARLMGVAEGDALQPQFITWSDDLAHFIGAPQPTLALARRAQAGLLGMARYFEQQLQQRRGQPPRDDLVGRLLQAVDAGEIDAGPELLAQCAMLLFAGHETTRNLLGNGLWALLSTPGAWQQLQDEPALLPNAVRELLRFEAPVQYTGRRVATDLEWHGQTLRRGELVVALIGAANRDPARHAAPDVLDLTRDKPGLLAFGSGPHVCIGASLSLLEAQIVFAQLLKRWPDLRLMDTTPAWAPNPVYRGLVQLNVRAG